LVYASLASIKVYAGLAPLNKALLSLIPVYVFCIYFEAWGQSILSNSKFAIGVSPVSCSGINCTSIFLPGSLDNIRVYGGYSNSTLFQEQDLVGSSVILAKDAPGYQLDFDSITEVAPFQDTDCILYNGRGNDGLYICITTVQQKLLMGQYAVEDMILTI
jgi:hypothetical protein